MRKVALVAMVLTMITAAGCESIHDDTPLSPTPGGLRTTTAEGGQDGCETQIIYDPETCSGYGGGESDPDGTVYPYTTGDDGSPSDTWFADSYDEAACPPGFKARYYAAGKGLWFNGFSTFTMSQWDQHHTYRLNTYEYTGYSTDKKWKITGIHHVADVQCRAASWSYWTGVYAHIARLHHERITSMASGASWGGEGGGEGGSGGGSGNCRTEYIVVEVSNDNGTTWQTYWEGYATVCD